uniref:NADP-dependent oxidoreductase domain-containing protein n=1 Tax=Periophthalmus magnuspinnatus TaxID=409849 RepID=A0A3B4APZ7_9GOBI
MSAKMCLFYLGICKSIGVSNFMVCHLEQLKEDSSVVPHVNQVEYHPYQQPTTVLEYCNQEKIVFEGYCPLAKGQLLNDQTVLQIAEKHRRTPAQICIRWSLQKGVVTIPKSTKTERIRENCQVSFLRRETALSFLTAWASQLNHIQEKHIVRFPSISL